MMRAFTLALVVLCRVAVGVAQNTPSPEFEVASIKRNTSLSDMGGGGPGAGGGYRLANMSGRSIAALAWGIPTGRVVGGPEWASGERYDIEARSKVNPTRDETRQMLQRLLRDRFQFV